ncbi:MAG: hypothetical protein WC884_03015 [Candidatus Paceibacterota bacterium]
MNTINLEKIWEAVITKTHKIKPNKVNLLKREILLVSQVSLGQYELAKSENNKELVKFCSDI